MRAFKRERRVTTVTELNKILSLIKTYGLTAVTIGIGGTYKTLNEFLLSKKFTGYDDYMTIQVKESKLEITTKHYEGKVTTYIFDLNLDETFVMTGHRAYAIFNQHYFKVKEAKDYHIDAIDRMFNTETGKYICSARPILGYNKSFNEKEIHNVYEYDINSAYANVLYHNIPDINNPIYTGNMIKLKKNQVGFLFDDTCTMVESGYADIAFNIIDSPSGLKNFCEYYFNLKKNSSGIAHQEAKAMLNLPIGYMQRKNPFLRSYVVNKCNRYIKSFIDFTTLYWNTDAIFTVTQLDDSLIGDEIGKFKEIRINKFRMKDQNYQIDDNDPVYRGVVKVYYKRFEQINNRKFNILKDKLECKKCMYSFNCKTLKLEKNYEKIN